MHRVLSFQMARGFGASSEYVTKRMCFSLVLSTAFFSLLGGFLLGRYVVERNLQIRADKAYLEIADNGLRITDNLQIFLIRILEQAVFDNNGVYSDKINAAKSNENTLYGFKTIFSRLPFFSEIIETTTCMFATVHGHREPDRRIVFSINREGIGIAIELAKAFNRIYMETSWRPRRTITFCVFVGTYDACKEELSAYIQSNIIAYIAVHGNAIQGKGFFISSGSDMIQNIICQSIFKIRYSIVNIEQFMNNITLFGHENKLPRLPINIPHAVLSFTNEKSKMNEHIPIESYHRVLAEIAGLSIWRLSESIVLQVDSAYMNFTIHNTLNSVNFSEIQETKDKLLFTVQQTITNIGILSAKLSAIEKSKCLEIRMANDLSLKLDQTLLCPDKDMNSKTDLIILSMLSNKNVDVTITYFNKFEACYKATNIFLENSFRLFK